MTHSTRSLWRLATLSSALLGAVATGGCASLLDPQPTTPSPQPTSRSAPESELEADATTEAEPEYSPTPRFTRNNIFRNEDYDPALERPLPAPGEYPVPDAELRELSAEAIGDGLTAALVEITERETRNKAGGWDNLEFRAADLRDGAIYYMSGSSRNQDGLYQIRVIREVADHVMTPEELARKQRLGG